MASTFHCSIVTPAQSVLDTNASYVTFEAWDGQRGVQRGASPFLAKLGVGTTRVESTEGGSKTFLVDGGFAQMQGDTLTLLADAAWDVASIDRESAEREYAQARDAVLDPSNTTPESRARVERAQRLASAKMALASR